MTERVNISHSIVIKIENVNDNEVISHPLLVLKGNVKCEQKCCTKSFDDATISVKINNNKVSSSLAISLNRFKSIFFLNPGENSVEIAIESPSHSGEVFLNVRCKPSQLKTDQKSLQLLFITPNDCNKESTQSICDKILLGGRLLQCLIAERLKEQGLGRKTFQLLADSCTHFSSKYSNQSLRDLNSHEIWTQIALELLEAGLITANIKVLAFLHLERDLEGDIACGRGNLALLNSAGVKSWAENVDQVQDHLKRDGNYSSSLGAALHELGHIFDLVHADQGIMARGYEDIDFFFTSQSNQTRSRNMIVIDGAKVEDGRAYFHRSAAVLLSYHPWINTDVVNEIEDGKDATITITGLAIRASGGIRVVELHSCTKEDIRLVKFWDFSRNPCRLCRYCLNVLDVRQVMKDGSTLSLLVQDFSGRIYTKSVDYQMN